MGTILCRYDEYGYFNPSQKLAHGVKAGDLAAIITMAGDLAGLIPRECYLVPVPNRGGFADNTLLLAHFIAGLSTGRAKVLDILKGKPRDSVYALKKEGLELDAGLLGFRLSHKSPDDRKKVYLLDNVIATGFTMYAAHKLIPQADILVHSVAKNTFNQSPYREYFGRVKTNKEVLFDRYRQNRIAENGLKNKLTRPRVSY